MPRLILTPLLALLLATLPAGAELVFEKTAVEAKPTTADTEVFARYPFRNTGDRVVNIKSVRSDCSCTTPTLTKLTYAPGETGEVLVKFEIGNRHGPQKKGVIVTTDDAKEPLKILTLTADLPQVLTLSASALLWTVDEGPAMKTITVKTPENVAVTELQASTKNPGLSTEVERVSPTEFRVHVTPQSRDAYNALNLDAVLKEGPAKRSMVLVRVR